MSRMREIAFTLNGRPVTAAVRPADTLVELLFGRFGLRGARESCGQGLCGACTVLVDGAPVSGCLYLADLLDGADVRTVEGLEVDGRLDPVQEAFIEAGAFQCGFCTPGFVLMVRALLDETPAPSDAEIADWLAGNLCRCSAYPEILAAVHRAAERRAAAG